MPYELIADRPGHAILREYKIPKLEEDQIRIRSIFSSTKHGTEMRAFRADSADVTDKWDPDLRLHMKGDKANEHLFPMKLGERFVGRVIEVGANVNGFQSGDRVVGWGGIKEIHTAEPMHFRVIPEKIPVENLVYDEAAVFALAGVRDAPIRVGDRVAVFGLGAIGQMVSQLARIAGASWIVASDPIERRRKAAARY